MDAGFLFLVALLLFKATISLQNLFKVKSEAMQMGGGTSKIEK